VLEGPHLLLEALASSISLEEVLVSPEFLDRPEGRDLTRRHVQGLAPPPIEVSPEVLASVTDADSPQGVVAIARLPRAGVEALPRRSGALYLYVGGLQDPGNVGALARTAEAAGVAGLALAPGTAHPNHPRALRASAGSLLRLPAARDVSPETLDRQLAELSPTWVALAPRGGRDLYRNPPQGTVVLAVGAEGPGLPDAVTRRADVLLTIPLEEPVESLNSTVAAAVVLFELRRRRGR